MAIITKEQLMQNSHPLHFKLLLNGGFGTGKTYTALTFPQVAYAMVEPHGIMTARQNPKLLEHIVYYEEFVPSDTEDIKLTFQRFDAFLKKAREDAEKGVIKTVVVDNLTHLLENRWLYIEKYEKTYGKSGEVDTRSMYGTLGRWAYRMTVLQLLSIGAHIVLTCHEAEEEEVDPQGKSFKTGQIISNTLGSFRDKVGGLFNASLFLELKREGVDKYRYLVRCRPSGGKPAKNNLNLPEVVEDVNYDKLVAALPKLTG